MDKFISISFYKNKINNKLYYIFYLFIYKLFDTDDTSLNRLK